MLWPRAWAVFAVDVGGTLACISHADVVVAAGIGSLASSLSAPGQTADVLALVLNRLHGRQRPCYL